MRKAGISEQMGKGFVNYVDSVMGQFLSITIESVCVQVLQGPRAYRDREKIKPSSRERLEGILSHPILLPSVFMPPSLEGLGVIAHLPKYYDQHIQ